MRHQIFYSDEYLLIKDYYGNKTALRSGVKLINHIEEGLDVMINRKASFQSMKAYCLHPILQSDEDFNQNYKDNRLKECCPIALMLAVEYRRVANSYLSNMNIDNFIGFTNNDVFEMLVADKIQNERDFTLYHEDSHKRRLELREYFNNWFDLIRVYQNKSH